MCHLFQNVKTKGEALRREDVGEIKPPQILRWYPEELGWTVSAPRQMLRRDNVLAPFHKFLVQMNDLGAINRQEAVSMIPPLMLDVQPEQSVIDMCAAPGSKTAQILETVAGRRGDRIGSKRVLEREGVVIANDADIRRCWMLSHQLKRFAAAELVVTHHEAQFFPKIMMFDRVLCDVPCTGDGTLRKAPDIWRRWTPDMGIGIHRLQRQILERGLDILKPGGRLVYSTCSMNPLENEAVVAHALRIYGDDIELADVSDTLPGLKRRDGLMSWKVKDNSGNLQKEESEDKESGRKQDGNEERGCKHTGVEKDEGRENGMGKVTGRDTGNSKVGWFENFEQVPLRRRKKIVRSLFPPSTKEIESGRFPLERCMRLVPHDQDTGAFFVSVFVKKTDAKIHRKLRRAEEGRDQGMEQNGIGKNEDEEREKGMNGPEQNGDQKEVGMETEVEHMDGEVNGEDWVGEGMEQDEDSGRVEDDEKRAKKGKKKRGTRLITDDPLIALKELNGDMLAKIGEFFGIDKKIGEEYLMTRGNDGATFKRVVAVSRGVRWLLRHSLGSKEGREDKVLRVVNAGVRILERTDRRDTECPFRLIHEGVESIREVMTRRVARTKDVATINKLVKEETVNLEKVECEELEQDLKGMSSGSCLVELEREGMTTERVVLWKGRANVAVVMPRAQSKAIVQRLEQI